MTGAPTSLRLAWARVPDGGARRSVAWALIGDLVPGAVLSNPCARCGGDHGPVRIAGAEFEASVAYAGDHAVVATVSRAEASAVGIDAELVDDPQRDAAGLAGVLGDRPADVRAWTRVEAALKAAGRGLRIDPALVDVVGSAASWTARLPGRAGDLAGVDLDGPRGVVLSAAFAIASS
jgi:4'-phosphopantetheinyl transferase